MSAQQTFAPSSLTARSMSVTQAAREIGIPPKAAYKSCHAYLDGDKTEIPCRMVKHLIRVYHDELEAWIDGRGGIPIEEPSTQQKEEISDDEPSVACTGCSDSGTSLCRETFRCESCGMMKNSCAHLPGWPRVRTGTCSDCEFNALLDGKRAAFFETESRKKRANGWTDEEEAAVVEMRSNGLSIAEISERLCRTEKAVYYRIGKKATGASAVKKFTAPAWTSWETDEAERLTAAGVHAKEIGERLGRTERAVKNRLRRVRLKAGL